MHQTKTAPAPEKIGFGKAPVAAAPASLPAAPVLTDIEPDDLATEQLVSLAMVAWKRYSDTGEVLTKSIRTLRKRLSAEQYRRLLESMPGFAM
jgi:hypothetical protein